MIDLFNMVLDLFEFKKKGQNYHYKMNDVEVILNPQKSRFSNELLPNVGFYYFSVETEVLKSPKFKDVHIWIRVEHSIRADYFEGYADIPSRFKQHILDICDFEYLGKHFPTDMPKLNINGESIDTIFSFNGDKERRLVKFCNEYKKE